VQQNLLLARILPNHLTGSTIHTHKHIQVEQNFVQVCLKFCLIWILVRPQLAGNDLKSSEKQSRQNVRIRAHNSPTQIGLLYLKGLAIGDLTLCHTVTKFEGSKMDRIVSRSRCRFQNRSSLNSLYYLVYGVSSVWTGSFDT